MAKEFKNFIITKFNGRDPNVVENWITEVEAYFAIKGFSSYAKTTVACQHLTKIALEWWNTYLIST